MKSQNIHKWGVLMGAGVVALGLAGCADRNKNGEPDSPATSTEINKTVDNAGGKMADAAKDAGNAVTDAGKAAGAALEPAVITPKIKTAIGGNPALKGSTIDVDTDGKTNTVTLKGTVKSDAQKKLAAAIAQKEAGGYKINNTVTVQK